jgi:LPXTG-motif cell wall-anchored protein
VYLPAAGEWVEADGSDGRIVMLDAFEAVNWWLTLTNTGNYEPLNVVPTWSLAGCDTDPRSIGVGQSVNVYCDTTMAATITATAGGSETLYGLSASDPATVTLRPVPESRVGINLEVMDRNGVWTSGGDLGGGRLPDDPIPVYLPTDIITWRVTLRNLDSRDANNLIIQGVGLPGCDTAITTLAAGATTSFTCTSTETTRTQRIAELFANGQVYASNQATVDIIPPSGGVPTATIDLLVLDSGIGKYVDADDSDRLVPNVLTGKTVFWRVVVVNTGTVALTGVTIGDTQTACGPIDINGLAVGGTITQDCTTTALYNRRSENRASNSGMIERTITMRATNMATASDIARVFIAQPASIGDQVWYDTDGSDTMNGDERGQPGVVVYLYLGGVEVANTTTDADGRYLFNNLLPGEYTVTFAIPSGNFVTTGPARATSLGLALTGSLATVRVTVSSGDIRPDISIGVRAQAADTPATPVTTATPPPAPTVPLRAGLPKTGTDARNLLEAAGLVSLLGVGFVLLGRRRKTATLPE